MAHVTRILHDLVECIVKFYLMPALSHPCHQFQGVCKEHSTGKKQPWSGGCGCFTCVGVTNISCFVIVGHFQTLHDFACPHSDHS